MPSSLTTSQWSLRPKSGMAGALAGAAPPPPRALLLRVPLARAPPWVEPPGFLGGTLGFSGSGLLMQPPICGGAKQRRPGRGPGGARRARGDTRACGTPTPQRAQRLPVSRGGTQRTTAEVNTSRYRG